MLDCGYEQPVARLLAPGNFQRGGERKHVGFCRATRESDVFGIGAKQLRDLLARFLNQTTNSPAFGVHGRCIACENQGGAHGEPRLPSEGGGGIPVEICALGQGLHQYLITDFTTSTPQKACFLPWGLC